MSMYKILIKGHINMKTRYLFGLPFGIIELKKEQIEVLIDTGFSGELMLPAKLIHKLGFQEAGISEYVLADGKRGDAIIYDATIDIFGKKIEIHIVESEEDFPLMGMGLLQHARTSLEPNKNILTVHASQ